MDAKLIEVYEFREQGYKPVLDYGEWRVAMLNGLDELLPGNIPWFQKHDKTDEAFVLLAGRCLLYAVDGKVPEGGPLDPELIRAVDMEPMKLYDVKRGVYHSHALEPGSSVLIIENRDTCDDNSPRIAASPGIQARTAALARQAWTAT